MNQLHMPPETTSIRGEPEHRPPVAVTHREPGMRLRNAVASISLLLLSACFFAAPASAQQQPDAKTAEKADAKSSDVKPVCANCHEDRHTSIAFAAHGAKNDANGSMCQACHGDATEHL